MEIRMKSYKNNYADGQKKTLHVIILALALYNEALWAKVQQRLFIDDIPAAYPPSLYFLALF
jgi:hypothetical protein